jgi:hypothetical protein
MLSPLLCAPRYYLKLYMCMLKRHERLSLHCIGQFSLSWRLNRRWSGLNGHVIVGPLGAGRQQV